MQMSSSFCNYTVIRSKLPSCCLLSMSLINPVIRQLMELVWRKIHSKNGGGGVYGWWGDHRRYFPYPAMRASLGIPLCTLPRSLSPSGTSCTSLTHPPFPIPLSPASSCSGSPPPFSLCGLGSSPCCPPGSLGSRAPSSSGGLGLGTQAFHSSPPGPLLVPQLPLPHVHHPPHPFLSAKPALPIWRLK